MADLVSHEPATGAELWRGEIGDVDAEVDAARIGWARWAAQPLTFRIETMRRFANAVRQRHEAFADVIARETGKPLWDARGEVDEVIATVNAAAAAYVERSAQRRNDGQMGARLAVRHKPHGVLAVITPHNRPAFVPAARIIPALIAGNCVVLKPSEKTPASAAFLVERLRAAGAPEGCVRLLIGGAAEGAALAAHIGIDGVLFTGSSRIGAALHRSFAGRPGKLVALAMGGNNALVAWDTPDLAAAAAIIVQSAFASAGQRSSAARRLIIHQDLADALLAEVNRLVGRLIVGSPHDEPAPFMGPVIDNEAADQLGDSFLSLLMRGGRAIRHLERLAADRPFLSPALIDVTQLTDRADVELFGPILQVIRVADFDAAIAEANTTRYGLCATLLSQTPALYDRFWASVRAGTVNWNRISHTSTVAAPWGGVGLSGNHRPGGSYASDHCAYPVVSNESDAARATIGIGLRDG